MCGGGDLMKEFTSMATFGLATPLSSMFKGPSAPPAAPGAIALPQEAHGMDLSLLYAANAKQAMKGSATQLTGPGGIDPKDLAIGYKNLLG